MANKITPTTLCWGWPVMCDLIKILENNIIIICFINFSTTQACQIPPIPVLASYAALRISKFRMRSQISVFYFHGFLCTLTLCQQHEPSRGRWRILAPGQQWLWQLPPRISMKRGTEIWNNKFGKLLNKLCTFVSILMKSTGNGKIWAGKTFLYCLIENLNHILVI